MPGAVPFTSTIALSNSTFGYARKIANLGLEAAAKGDNAILTGINAYAGKCTNKGVADSVGVEFTDALELI